jgi:hypothetical protein
VAVLGVGMTRTMPPPVHFHAAALKPARFRLVTDEQEHIARRALVLVAAARVAPSGAVHSPGTDSPCRLTISICGCSSMLSVERGFDAVDQIARHSGRQRRPTHQHVDLGSVLRQKHRSPAVRVTAADQGDLLICAPASFDRRGPAPDAAAFELFQPRHVGQAVACAAGDDNDACIQQASVVDLDGGLALRP